MMLQKDEEERGPLGKVFRMPSNMNLGPLTLRVRYLEKILLFYENDFGFKVKNRRLDSDDGLEVIELGFNSNKKGELSANSIEPALILKRDPDATKSPSNSAGLYHFAILVPDRKSLASTYLAIGNSGMYYDGFADHGVSEALYLQDPEDNGIEIYRDRPRKEWKYDNSGHLQMDTLPLDIESLLKELTKDERKNPVAFPSGAKIGHMHLRVTNLERSVSFYHEKLGLDIIVSLPRMGAAFLSAGGYHHHVGINTWQSSGGSPHMRSEAGLENFTFVVQDRTILDELASRMQNSAESVKENADKLLVSDPDGMQILIKSG
jgi:catechol 2,3-dioxygenase